MAGSDAQLDELRRRIDALDQDIVGRLNERSRLVAEIGRWKADAGIPVYVPDRERQVLERVGRLNEGPLSNRTLGAIYRELMSGSFVLERPPRIAYLGPRGSFSHLAVARKFGSSVEAESMSRVEGIFEEVEREHVDLGVVPVENSAGGGVVDTLDAFVEHNVRVCAEISLAVHHHLLGRCDLEDVEVVYSRPEAFAQCRRWLTETGLFDKRVAVASTSRAAELAAAETNAAAIAGSLAAELYGLRTLRDRIEDEPDNTTRFLVISRQAAAPTGDDKTSLVFSAADRPGALVEVLDVWRQAEVNMTFIESRPSRRRKWAYSFFVDLEGHGETANLRASLESARRLCVFFKVLGSFPRAGEVLH